MEILSLPKADEAIIHSAMLGIGDIKLTKKQYAAHVKNIISLLKTNTNYDVVLGDMPIPNIIILAKENFGVIMISTQAPYCTFAFTEQNMVGALWDHLSNIRDKSLNKKKTIKILEKSIDLKSM